MATKAAKLAEWLRERAPVQVEPGDLAELRTLLAPVSDSGLRRLLRASGANLHPLAAGVDQDSFASLRNSLIELAACYESGPESHRRLARTIVITAKDHAKLAARNPRVSLETQMEKAEMAAWMLTWLENPTVFPVWVRLREASLHLDGGDLN